MTLIAIWLRGIFARRSGRLLAAALGVAATVALLASLGIFINGSAASMTQRALGDVPVDWQVQLVPGTNPDAVTQALATSAPYTTLERVGYADVAGFNAISGGTTQTTGAGKILGVSDTYWRSFPQQLRALLGRTSGVLIAQQTAANLHAGIGDEVTIARLGQPPATVRIDGVIDLPNADSLFQAVGVPSGAAPQAPPDNILILPLPQWHQLFDPQVAVRPDSVRLQLHVRLRHDLPPDPRDAFVAVEQRAHNFEARIAGSAAVGDNLAARLDAVREDALYASILFLFLGAPGALLAIFLTIAVAASGATRRRREQALLRIRGASAPTVLRLESLETIVIGIAGVLAGLGAAWLIAQRMSPGGPPTLQRAGFSIVLATLIGFLTAAGAVIVPAWRELRHGTVAEARAFVGRGTKPLWERIGLDLILLILAVVIYWRTAATGYRLVLAAEGVAQTSVSYEAFVAPLSLWLGVGLLVTRIMRRGLASWRGALARVLTPLAGALSPAVAASIARQRNVVTRGVVLVALAFSFAVSTAVFNTTYNAQSRVDAELTNGADVTVTGSTPYPASEKLDAIRRTPGVGAAEPMIHRFAYVGNDLQDIYGIEPGRISNATSLSDAYFSKITAKAAMAALTAHNDGVFVSQETVNDFQLKIGDLINLRLQNMSDHQYHVVPFHLLGIVREFPTAPKDSFLITNARYIASVSGSDAREIVLIRSAIAPASLAQRLAPLGAGLPGARVTDIGSVQRTISSSLTAVDLHGLTLLELTFAVLLIAGAAGLVLGLGLIERRRDFALLAAIGATAKQIGAFVWAEALLVIVCGGVVGTATGFSLAHILVKLLTGVFDPAPEHLVVPWCYLVALVVAGALSVITAVITVERVARRHTLDALRTI